VVAKMATFFVASCIVSILSTGEGFSSNRGAVAPRNIYLKRQNFRGAITHSRTDDTQETIISKEKNQSIQKTENDIKAGLGAAAIAAGVTLWGAHLTWEVSAAVAVAANIASARNDTLGEVLSAAGTLVAKSVEAVSEGVKNALPAQSTEGEEKAREISVMAPAAAAAATEGGVFQAAEEEKKAQEAATESAAAKDENKEKEVPSATATDTAGAAAAVDEKKAKEAVEMKAAAAAGKALTPQLMKAPVAAGKPSAKDREIGADAARSYFNSEAYLEASAVTKKKKSFFSLKGVFRSPSGKAFVKAAIVATCATAAYFIFGLNVK